MKYKVQNGWVTYYNNKWYKSGDIIETSENMTTKIREGVIKEVKQ